MSHDEENKISVRMSGLESKMDEVITAIQGNEQLGINGMVQNIKHMQGDINDVKEDVKGLKSERNKLVMWATGFAAGAGAIGAQFISWIKD